RVSHGGTDCGAGTRRIRRRVVPRLGTDVALLPAAARRRFEGGRTQAVVGRRRARADRLVVDPVAAALLLINVGLVPPAGEPSFDVGGGAVLGDVFEERLRAEVLDEQVGSR